MLSACHTLVIASPYSWHNSLLHSRISLWAQRNITFSFPQNTTEKYCNQHFDISSASLAKYVGFKLHIKIPCFGSMLSQVFSNMHHKSSIYNKKIFVHQCFFALLEDQTWKKIYPLPCFFSSFSIMNKSCSFCSEWVYASRDSLSYQPVRAPKKGVPAFPPWHQPALSNLSATELAKAWATGWTPALRPGLILHRKHNRSSRISDSSCYKSQKNQQCG